MSSKINDLNNSPIDFRNNMFLNLFFYRKVTLKSSHKKCHPKKIRAAFISVRQKSASNKRHPHYFSRNGFISDFHKNLCSKG